jgi:hypothetical protein
MVCTTSAIEEVTNRFRTAQAFKVKDDDPELPFSFAVLLRMEVWFRTPEDIARTFLRSLLLQPVGRNEKQADNGKQKR